MSITYKHKHTGKTITLEGVEIHIYSIYLMMKGYNIAIVQRGINNA